MDGYQLTLQDKNYLKEFHGHFHSREEAEQYLYDSWIRLLIVFQWLLKLQSFHVHKVLELGANPYYLTLLIKKYFNFEMQLANYFGDSSDNGLHSQMLESAGERHEFGFMHFNVEMDCFPYDNNSFDCIIFCEILEHLLLNTDFAIAQMQRVLKPGGYLIVSTPNVTRLGNLSCLLKGKNIYDGYSPYGIYGRHNREYTLKELTALLQNQQFTIVEAMVKNIYYHPLRSLIIQALRPETWHDHLFVLAQKSI